MQALQSSRSWSSTLIGVGRGVCVTPRMPLMESSPRPQKAARYRNGPPSVPTPPEGCRRDRIQGYPAPASMARPPEKPTNGAPHPLASRECVGRCVFIKEGPGPSACRNRERARPHRHGEGLAPGPCGGSCPWQLGVVNDDLNFCLRPRETPYQKGRGTFARPQEDPGPGL